MNTNDVLFVGGFTAVAFLVVWAVNSARRKRELNRPTAAAVSRRKAPGTHKSQSASSRYAKSDRNADRLVSDAAWEKASLLQMTKDVKEPDAKLRAKVWTADGYYDILIGAFRKERFLRFVMRGDNHPNGADLHSWDLPFDRQYHVVFRWRTTPGYPLKTQGPDGTYQSKYSYFETRLYQIGRGSARCLRLVDGDDMFSEAPFQWFRAHLADFGVQFAADSEEEALYGDASDSLAEYLLEIQSRADAEEDAKLARGAMSLSKAQIAELKKASGAKLPEKVRTYLSSADYWDDADAQLSRIRDVDGNRLSRTFTDYTKRVLELMLVRAVPARYCAIFFYDNFPHIRYEDDLPTVTKEALASLIRWTRNKFIFT